jgi:FkbM family methyltransferase
MMEHRYFGHNGIVSESIKKNFPEGHVGYVIDVGASDGISVNSTYSLEKNYRWNVLSVEPNPYYEPMLVANRTLVEMCACGSVPSEASAFHIHLDNPEAYSALTVAKHPTEHASPDARWSKVMVPVRTIDQLMAKWEFPRLDALCIDTEGTELDVLKGCDMVKWKPRVVVIEAWDSDGPVHEYLRSMAYTNVDTSVHNYIYRLRKR